MLIVQEPDGLGVKAVSESGSPCSDAPVTSARRQQCEKFTAWMAVVLDDLPCFSQTSCVVDELHEGRWQPMMRSAVFTTLCRALRSAAEQLPNQAVVQLERMLSMVHL